MSKKATRLPRSLYSGNFQESDRGSWYWPQKRVKQLLFWGDGKNDKGGATSAPPEAQKLTNSLFRSHQRVGDGMNRQSDAILYADFAHQLGDMRLYRTFFDAQGGADFLI
jgi:hypothetical protein